LWALSLLLVAVSVRATAGDVPLAELDKRFTPVEAPVFMEYDVGYRFLNIELRRVGKIVASTTIGRWKHRVTGVEVPALFLDMKVNSPDSGKAGERGRVSIHDRIVAVMTVPDMQALVFAKYTDEFLNPFIGRSTEALSWSMYDTQSGHLEYENHDLKKNEVKTDIVNPEALMELSRKIRPVMEFLVAQYQSPSPDAATSDKGRIVVNMDGKVVALRIKTTREKSPSCLARNRLDSMLIKTVAERGSSIKPRDFQAWSMTFKQLAALLHDDSLTQQAIHAPVETVVPLAVNYELGLGSIRATMTSIHVGPAVKADRPLVMAEGPKSVVRK
jgi:hypothetical protein